MACATCGKKKKAARKIYSIPASVKPRQTEGINGYLEIVYVGTANGIRLRGCETNKLYLFGRNIKRVIDADDAECFLRKKPNEFEVFIEDAESDNSEGESEFPESTSGINEGNGQVHKVDAQEFSGDN